MLLLGWARERGLVRILSLEGLLAFWLVLMGVVVNDLLLEVHNGHVVLDLLQGCEIRALLDRVLFKVAVGAIRVHLLGGGDRTDWVGLVRAVLCVLPAPTLASLVVIVETLVFLAVRGLRLPLLECLEILTREGSSHHLHAALELAAFHRAALPSMLLLLGVELLHLLKVLKLLELGILRVHDRRPLEEALVVLGLLR